MRKGPHKTTSQLKSLLAIGIACVTLAACNPELMENGKELQPLSSQIKAQIKKIGSTENASLYIRIFKEEEVLEAWKQRSDGTYALLKSYPICAYSGELGPKIKEGDRQAPEGFYAITPGQMNPRSSYYLSFNLGYPNKFDRAYGRTGKHLMVHGSCSSRGCYAMEDAPIAEIYALGREAFDGGQRSFKVHAFPFRMTPENMARHRDSKNFAFWQNLKNGYDHFEITRKVPNVEVCNRTYIFDPQGATHFDATGPCPAYTLEPSLLASLKTLRAQENVRFREEVARLEEKKQEHQTEVTNEMVDAQMDLLKRKERVAEGKNPDGFLVGLLKGNPTATAPQPQSTNPGSIAAPADTAAVANDQQTAAGEIGSGQTNGSFFSRFQMPTLFDAKDTKAAAAAQADGQADRGTPLMALPQTRQQ